MKKPTIIIGCSSYYNSYWQPVFYPEGMPRSKWFGYYCEFFNTYELNATFYKFPTVKSLQGWYAKAPENFLFAVKAPKVITHLKKFNDCKLEVDDFYAVCKEGLQHKLGNILFQLPPSYDYSQERLELILGYMNPTFCNVIEFRNKSWWTSHVYETLTRHNITFCSVNYPDLPDDVIKTAATGYIRLHGNPKLFYSQYSVAELQQLYDTVAKHTFDTVYVYFNNTASKAGILNALEFETIDWNFNDDQ